MSIEHLHHCVEEITTAFRFLQLENSDFFKRGISRLIAVRIDDFYKLGFKVNKATINSRRIKDDLNALKEFYENYFKIQRDKYGAHFQHLDLLDRWEYWMDINIDTASFFFSQSKDIYVLFLLAPGYILLSPAHIDTSDKNRCLQINENLNPENRPNMSMDILGPTRPNSAGMIHGTGLQSKGGTLKSIEMLLNYELAIIDAVHNSPELKQAFIKMFIIDVVSYADNLYTRTDVTPGAPQAEDGFDAYLTAAEFPAIHQVLTDFKANYRFQSILDELRGIRNTMAGHIDENLPVHDIKTTLTNLDIKKYREFYEHLKRLINKISFLDIRLRPFALEPVSPMHDVHSINGMETKPFDDSKPVTSFINTEITIYNAIEYERQLQMWLNDRDENAQRYFFNCGSNSPIVERACEEILLDNSQIKYEHYDRREYLNFFQAKLSDPNLPSDVKKSIIDLLISLKRGFPDTLAIALVQTYPDDTGLQLYYLYGLSCLMRVRSRKIFEWLIDKYKSNDFFDRYNSLHFLFEIDLSSRLRSNGQHDQNISTFSDFIKSRIEEAPSFLEKITFSVGLASELVFGEHHLGNKLNDFYLNFFKEVFTNAIDKYLSPIIKNSDDRIKIDNMKKTFTANRFSTLISTLATFLSKHDNQKIADSFNGILNWRVIQFSPTDEQELHNYAVASFKAGDIKTAIEVAKFLVDRHPDKKDHYFLLLSLYLEDQHYEASFNATRNTLLAHFNLSEDEIAQYSSWSY